MKKTFLRILPIVAAVLLATSCSKDDNGDVNSVDTPQTTEVPNPTTEQPAETTVKIPFTVKVGGGESLSKIGYALQKDGDNDIWNKVTRTFDDDDLAGGTHPITLTVKGAAEGSGITESAIPLKRDSEGNYYFEGDIEVASEKVSDFNSEPGIALVGEFNVTGTTLPTSSNESLAKLMESCAHTYKTKDDRFQIYMSPIAGKVTFVMNQDLADQGAFGVKKGYYDQDSIWVPGEHIAPALGVNVIVNYKQPIGKSITYTTLLNTFYNYAERRDDNRLRLDVNWENTINFAITKYITTILFVHFKYDHNTTFPVYEEINGVQTVVDNVPKLQFKESLGIAFVHKF